MRRVPVVVTGIGVICPLGRNVEEFWSNLTSGKAAVRPATQPAFAGMENVWVGEVPDEWVTEGLPEGSKPGDRFSALALVAAAEALRSGGLAPETLAAEHVGVVVGQCQFTIDSVEGTFLPLHASTDSVADHWSLSGPRVVISTACAASANAVGAGRDLLWAGEADIVLAGGADNLQKSTHVGFDMLTAVADGPTSPYSLSHGLSLGEGAAFLVLETAEHAKARGARILAEVGGYGLSADAYHATAPDPTGKGPLRAVHRALDDAGLTSADISYVNGHGTGTPTNDRMERKAMQSLFGDSLPNVPISSTKSGIGHTLGASGAIEAVTCVMALEKQMAPPTVNFVGDGPEGFDFVPHTGRPMPIDVTLSNNYAFGGNNCSVVLARPGRLEMPEQDVPDLDVVISGIGLVSGYGLGVDAWRDGVRSGASAISEIELSDGGKRFGTDFFPLGRKPLAAAGLWRHLAAYGRSGIAAATFALTDAGIRTHGPGREDIGLVFATSYGPVSIAVELGTGIETPEGASALSFSNATINAAAGAVCQALVLRGATTTISNGAASALVALDNALHLLRTGHASRIMLLATDEVSEMLAVERGRREQMDASGVVRPYDVDRSGMALGAASVALLLETTASVEARGGRAYAKVHGVSQTGATDGAFDDVAERGLRALLRRTGVEASGVGLVAGSGSGAEGDVQELRAIGRVFGPETLLTAPKSLTGECEAASGAINLVTAALALHEGLVPATAGLVSPLPEADVRHVTSPMEGAALTRAVATASTPGSLFTAALLGPA